MTIHCNTNLVQIRLDGVDRFAEVHFFVQLPIEDDLRPGVLGSEASSWSFANVALVQLYSPAHQQLAANSFGTVLSCLPSQPGDLHVIDVKTILAVVGMVPHTPRLPTGETEDRFFVVEKSGLDVARTGPEDDDLNDNDGDTIDTG